MLLFEWLVFLFCTSIDVEIESKQHTESITEIFYFICVNIFCCERFCKRLKWPKGSEKGSPTELGQRIIPNFYLFRYTSHITTQMNWTKINSYGKNEVCSFCYRVYRIIVKFFYFKSLLDPLPKNEILIFFSFLNHEITKHLDDLVFRILTFRRFCVYIDVRRCLPSNIFYSL